MAIPPVVEQHRLALREMLRVPADQFVDASIPTVTNVAKIVIEEASEKSATSTETSAVYFSPERAVQLRDTAESVRRTGENVAGQVNEECARPLGELSKASAHIVTDAAADTTVTLVGAAVARFNGQVQ